MLLPWRLDVMNEFPIHFLICGLGQGWKFATCRLSRQIRAIKPNAKILTINEETLVNAFPTASLLVNELGGVASKGYGYWIWKPLVIHDILKSLEDDAILFYIDAGCEINVNGLARFENYLNTLHFKSYLLFSLPDKAIDHIDESISDYFNICKSELQKNIMTLATFMAFKKKGGEIPKVLEAWREAAIENPRLFKADTSQRVAGNPNFRFRHDQSVLSAIAIKNKLETIPNEVDTPESKSQKSNYFVLALRNRAPFSVAPGTLGFQVRIQYWNVTRFIRKLFGNYNS
jgi:hypothetical protein